MKKTLIAMTVCAVLAACSQPAPGTDVAKPADAAVAADAAMPANADAGAAVGAAASTVEEPAAEIATNPAIRMIRATCPGDIRVQAADGGPVLIGKELATVTSTKPDFYEATESKSGLTVSVTINPDGTQQMSYTGKDRSNGVCTVEATASTTRIAKLNATCGDGIEFHVDDGGSAYINGRKATLRLGDPSYYDATDAESGISVSVSIDRRGRSYPSYSGKNGVHGICKVKD